MSLFGRLFLAFRNLGRGGSPILPLDKGSWGTQDWKNDLKIQNTLEKMHKIRRIFFIK
jgi:hypothetical protein